VRKGRKSVGRQRRFVCVRQAFSPLPISSPQPTILTPASTTPSSPSCSRHSSRLGFRSPPPVCGETNSHAHIHRPSSLHRTVIKDNTHISFNLLMRPCSIVVSYLYICTGCEGSQRWNRRSGHCATFADSAIYHRMVRDEPA